MKKRTNWGLLVMICAFTVAPLKAAEEQTIDPVSGDAKSRTTTQWHEFYVKSFEAKNAKWMATVSDPAKFAKWCAKGAPPKSKETNILLWGASGCQGISHMLPEMAKDIGQTVNVRVLSRSFNRYPVAIRAAEAGKRAPDGVDPDTLPDKGAEHGYVNLEKDRSTQVHAARRELSTIMFVDKTFTPMLHMIGDQDPFCTPATEFHRKLLSLNVESELKVYEGERHGFFNDGKPQYSDTLLSMEKFLIDHSVIDSDG